MVGIMQDKFDYLIVGAGLFGSILAYRLHRKGFKVLVIDKRNHVGGNVYTEYKDGIHIHKYGPHIFHTNDKQVWDFMNDICEFENYIYSPLAYNGDFYNLPFNMNTFKQVYFRAQPNEIKEIISEYKIDNITNVEELGISALGKPMYELLVKNYTEKQWGAPCNSLDLNILKRIPVRFEYNNNYFNDRYQGIPTKGYTYIIEKLLDKIPVKLNTPYQEYMYDLAHKIIFCGAIDELCNYIYGELPYRSLVFSDKHPEPIFKDFKEPYGVAVINNCTTEEWTRRIEHKMFLKSSKDLENNIITYEYPTEWTKGLERYYPIPSPESEELYNKYKEYLKNKYPNIIPCGRLGEYKYLNMDQIVKKALDFKI